MEDLPTPDSGGSPTQTRTIPRAAADLPPCYPELRDRRVVVTGGASGIGLATARRFIAEGSRVAVLDRDRERLAGLATELPALAGTVAADVASPAEMAAAFEAVDRLLGGVDVVVANAGVSFRTPFSEIDDTQWQAVIGTNLTGAFLTAREAIRRMQAQGSGVLLFTASTNGLRGHPNYADYNASKAGVMLLMRTIALEVAPSIRVNAVNPGYVLTPMQEREYGPEMLAAVNDAIPMQRHAEPAEVAALFAFLASDQAAYITGTTIDIDGGENA